ncbi:hypothetical protein [Staphylococcus equorum]|uniref:Phage tail protein n=2 Tax=Staphylococcus TaxID=1279 RepID=A0AAW7AMN0_9STAP|nr:hypothetical protein [Staphylococcus equorum]MDK9866770.1 hypothetical protein [Staphylococcus equorum]
MARKEITTPLDLKNMDNHNYNYDELYGLIDETDRRISEDMWEEIKKANTMKMLEPVQTSSELPSEAPDKSFITVIDEQRVYTYFQGKWQPFNEIDLDPFEPFKEELAAIFAAYEEQIKNITTEVQNTKTSAIDSVQSTQTQSEASITQTKQSAIDSINQTQTDTESQISTIRDEMTTQASDLTALFNDHMAQLTSKQDTALAEVESAKQAAITALEDFNNTDTSNWQKYKLTESNGDRIRVSDIDPVELGTGFYQIWNTYNMPETADGVSAYWNVDVFSAQDTKQIRATLSGENRVFQKNIHKGEDLGWKELSSDDSGWIYFDLINGAVGDTAFKASGDNGFNCAYRIIEKDGVSEKKLRINAKNVSHRQVIAQLPDGFAKNLQYHFVRVPVDLGLTGMVGVYPNGKIYIYVNADKQTEWESRSGEDVYFYGEVNWVD